MTDNEKIICGLEHCANYGNCSGCPMNDDKCCRDTLIEQSLAIISRQKEKIDKYEKHIEYLNEQIEHLVYLKKVVEEEYDRVYEQAEANVLGNMSDGGTSCHWCISKHEVNAIKEFAEMVKKELAAFVTSVPEMHSVVDNTVEEVLLRQ